jgi:hypothetical protein
MVRRTARSVPNWMSRTITSHVSDNLSGFIGLVVEPDAATIQAACELAATLLPADAEQRLGSGSLPHLTLTQCAVHQLPRARIAAFADRLTQRLAGRGVPLGPVIALGGGFLFWCVAAEAPERSLLQQAHEEAITLSQGFLDPVANGAVVEATRRLTGDDATLVANVRDCGYAFVRDRYLPHVTLGFDPRLSVSAGGAPGFQSQEHRHTLRSEQVVAVQFGAYGRVEWVLTI